MIAFRDNGVFEHLVFALGRHALSFRTEVVFVEVVIFQVETIVSRKLVKQIL
jgi:hypothetical protein